MLLNFQNIRNKDTISSHKNLMPHVEPNKALSHKAKLIAFLFKATKVSETTK
jgi:hypothetical protein